MKNRASLVLIELSAMLLVFALAAALCLRVFAWADTRSVQNAQQDRGLLQLQNAAEVLKHCGGDHAAAAALYGGTWDGTQWVICYDEAWVQTGEAAVYRLQAVPRTCDTPYLGASELALCLVDGTTLAALTVCWQEVAP